MSLLSGLWNKLRDKAYRKGYAESYVSMLVPFQIRALRKAREWTLADLADQSGVSQEQLECLEEAGYDPQNLSALYKIAGAFDVGVLVEFVPFSKLVSREKTFQPDTFNVVSFDDDELDSTITATSYHATYLQPDLVWKSALHMVRTQAPGEFYTLKSPERSQLAHDIAGIKTAGPGLAKAENFYAAMGVVINKQGAALQELYYTDEEWPTLTKKRTSSYSFTQGGETWLPSGQ